MKMNRAICTTSHTVPSASHPEPVEGSFSSKKMLRQAQHEESEDFSCGRDDV
jgi:hypothetical protein